MRTLIIVTELSFERMCFDYATLLTVVSMTNGRLDQTNVYFVEVTFRSIALDDVCGG